MSERLAWRQVHWFRPLDLVGPVAAVRAWAADHAAPKVVLEARADAGGVVYLLGVPSHNRSQIARELTAAVPSVRFTEPTTERLPVNAAARVRLSTRHRALNTDAPEATVRQILSALSQVRAGERLVLQLVLGARRVPLAVPNQTSSASTPWPAAARKGHHSRMDGEQRTALRNKVSDYGFAATLRLGVFAGNAARRRSLIRSLYSALRITEAPGVQARLTREVPNRIHSAASPWLWPLRLNVTETVALSGWPIGDDDLPGLPPIHPRQVAPAQLAVPGDRVIANALAPGVRGQLGYSIDDAMRHTWVISPTGSGKSTLLQHLIVQDMRAGRPVVVIEPSDLVADLLSRIPEDRRSQVAVLDCLDEAPIGVNPLMRYGRSPEVTADGLLATFQAIYGEGLGPRSTDILANCLNVLARREDASLAMLPLLLTHAAFRHSLTQHVIREDPIAAGPFWAWFNGLSEEARAQVIAPLSNKIRPLLRPALRNVLGQRRPRFNIRDVLRKNTILLVPLQKGVVGPDTAAWLSALVLAELWLALRERRAIPEHRRTPVMIYVDEAPEFLRLPTDLADILATSRSLKAGWVLAHQFRHQLSPAMLAAFEANARSKVCFQMASSDARAMAAGQSVITPEDFSALPAFHIYASLLRGNTVQPWASGVTMPSTPVTSRPADIRARSRQQYGQPLDQVETDFANLLADTDTPSSTNRRTRGAS